MKTNNQHQQIIKLHEHGDWVCSTAIEFIRDQRKRISELNHSGYTFEAKRCDGRCGKKHHSALLMRRLISVPEGSIKIAYPTRSNKHESESMRWMREESEQRNKVTETNNNLALF